ncbi:glycosyltransferase [Zobellella iuensis]|uniref:Glycosyltransferase n=1 Tax=Zobellella iuensis TaxID=2803811 RepID=A0ABS1QSB0_9GAMM|nr:glycosyltransferase [Zobellella iuensis]MBL1377758.1 glycosyltransferase [Zobellella iuensis]
MDQLIEHAISLANQPAIPLLAPIKNRIAYVVSHGQSYASNGYAIRTQGVAKALNGQGFETLCFVRPGRPWDLGVEKGSIQPEMQVDGVRYIHSRWLQDKRPKGKINLFNATVDRLVHLLRLYRPSVVLAASNHEIGLPAWAAAKQLGLPFHYEVRGFWEVSRASRQPGWEKTDEYQQHYTHESFLAQHADQLYTLNSHMQRELVQRGAKPGSIHLVPNSVSELPRTHTTNSSSTRKQLGIPENAFVLGYIGAITEYEGLEQLLEALAELKKTPVTQPVHALIVGGYSPVNQQAQPEKASILDELKTRAKQLGVSSQITWTGRVEHGQLPAYFAAVNATVIPRKPLPVCELVSAIKPLEYLSYGKPIIASNVAPQAELLQQGKLGWLYQKGDAKALAAMVLQVQRANKEEIKVKTEAGIIAIKSYYLWHQSIQPLVAGLNMAQAPRQEELSELKKQELSVGSVEKTIPDDQPSSLCVQPIPLPPGKNTVTAEQKLLLDEKLKIVYQADGFKGVHEFIKMQTAGRNEKFLAFCQVKGANVVLAGGDAEQACLLAEQALKTDLSATTLRSAARVFYNAAKIKRAIELVDKLESSLGKANDNDAKFISEVRGRAKLIEWAEMPASKRVQPKIKQRVLNVLAFSLPYTSVGYATRSHGLARGIKRGNWDVRPYTRPGFPYDFKPELVGNILPEKDDIDDITYHRILENSRTEKNEVEYLIDSISYWEKIIDSEQPEIIHAASNYVTALPALIAARRKGVPFIYEIRGFWEVTRSSRDSSFANTAKYRYMQLFERLVVNQSDRIITITTAMKELLVKNGAKEDKIAIAFNSVDPDRFLPRAPNKTLASKIGIPENIPVIGYIGSFVDYEGLDDLIEAVSFLRDDGVECRLLLVGDGAITESLKHKIIDLKLHDIVLMTGRVPHDEVEDYYSLIDIAPFPRKPWEVCELVSPLKPFEAMALQKAVVVSNTRALNEIVKDGYNGIVFNKGCSISLKNSLLTLIKNKALRAEIGENARNWIIDERSWNVAGKACIEEYSKLI